MEYHYTYELRCKETDQLYIGKRSCKVSPNEDKYWSSSRTVKSMIKQGLTFSKTILREFGTAQEAIQHEIELHKLFDVASNDKYLNKVRQTSTGFDTTGVVPKHLTTEHQIKAGSAGGKSLTFEQRSAAGKIGGSKFKDKTREYAHHNFRSENPAKLKMSCTRCRSLIGGVSNLTQHYSGKRCQEFIN